MTATITLDQAAARARQIGEDRMRAGCRIELSAADIAWGKRAFTRLLLLVPVEDGGHQGRSETWLLANNTGATEMDISDAVWGVTTLEHPFGKASVDHRVRVAA